jgi:serine/threonine protein kinase
MKQKRLGPYRLVRVLGRGGMGTVYEAVNEETDEPAAVKVLSAVLSKQKGFRQRFEGEIATLRKLRHPNIVRLFGFGEQEGLLFYAMELVDGKTLQEELDRGRLFDWPEVARIGIETCKALRHAHDRGIVHRDIKPANLLLTPEGVVKLSDFGIARLFGTTGLTTAGIVLGTVEFMAPEQADSRTPGPRADLYSLGGVFFALLTGRPPFRATSPMHMLDKHRKLKPEPIRRYVPQAPAELENIIAQLLEKSPEDRIANAMVLLRRLEAVLEAAADSPGTESAGTMGGGIDVLSPTEAARPDEPQAPQTRMIGEEADSAVTADSSPTPQAQDLPETKATSAFRGMEAAEDQSGKPRPAPEAPDAAEYRVQEEERKPGRRFTPIKEEELDRLEREEPSGPSLITPQTLALVVGLILVGAGVWYFLRPLSADALYERVTAAVDEGTESSLSEVENEIQEFLTEYADDPRCEQLREYQEEIELDRLERRLERRASGQKDTQELLPIERMCLEAISYERLSPELGLRKLKAIVDLYQDRAEDSGPIRQWLRLARRRMQRLSQQVEESRADDLALLTERLDSADELSQSDSAEKKQAADEIRRAVIEIGRDKPWAEEVVRRAREALRDRKGMNWSIRP